MTLKVHTSPKRGYRLVISPVQRGAHQGDHSLGQVFGPDGVLIAAIPRNFGSFPFLFIEDHPHGDFLVCGEDYQGQTVIELRSGQRRDHLSEGYDQGWGFCWAQATYHANEQVLVVDGCHWACPYEFRFFDFSDPMNGWPEITCERCIDADPRPPEFHPDGTITTFQSTAEGAPAATLTFRREGLALRLLDEWVSEAEQQARAASEQARIDYERWLTEFKESDPLFLAMKRLLQDPIFQSEASCSVGRTYAGWCPDFPQEEFRLCQRIHRREGEQGYTLDLEWGALTGPIKLVLFLDGNNVETKFWMDHAVESIEAAFTYARALLCAPERTQTMPPRSGTSTVRVN